MNMFLAGNPQRQDLMGGAINVAGGHPLAKELKKHEEATKDLARTKRQPFCLKCLGDVVRKWYDEVDELMAKGKKVKELRINYESFIGPKHMKKERSEMKAQIGFRNVEGRPKNYGQYSYKCMEGHVFVLNLEPERIKKEKK